jgi:poly(A) polymerase
MNITPDWLLNPDLQRLMRALMEQGFATYCVGGCVRNALMGLGISDVDLATAATPEIVTKCAVSHGFSVIPTGIDHGTVTVVLGGKSYEITTFRRDVSADGRHAKVAFSTDVAQDAARRDFTINAIYLDADGAIIDPINALPDLRARRLRFIGSADARIREDYLRILRYFRFFAVLDVSDGLDADALAACAEHADQLAMLSRERVGQEMRKLLAAQNPAPAIAAMQNAGILQHVLPQSDARFLPPLIHFEAGLPQPWIARLAILGERGFADALRLSRQEQADLSNIRQGFSNALSIAALGYSHHYDVAKAIVLGRSAMFETPAPQNWHDELARGAAAIFPVTAADFMPQLSGPELGAAIKAAKDQWLASDLHATKNQLLQTNRNMPRK